MTGSLASGASDGQSFTTYTSNQTSSQVPDLDERRIELMDAINRNAGNIGDYLAKNLYIDMYKSRVLSLIYDIEDLGKIMEDKHATVVQCAMETARIPATVWENWMATWGAPKPRLSLEDVITMSQAESAKWSVMRANA